MQTATTVLSEEATLEHLARHWRDNTHTFIWGTVTKWDVYGYAFQQVDARRLTLRDVVRILGEHANVREEVVRMRRRDWLGMKASS